MIDDNLNHQFQPIGYGQAFIHGCPLNVHHHHDNSANSITNCYFSNDQPNLYHSTTMANLKSMFSINLQKTGLIIDNNDIDQWIIDDGNNNVLDKNIHISQVIIIHVYKMNFRLKFFFFLFTEW